MSRAGCLALVLFGLLAFCNAVRHPFVHDDIIFILQNPHIAELDRWPQAFQVSASTGGLNTYYRPALEILYRLEYHLFGPNPYGYHLFNIIIHIMNGLLLFGLLQRLGLREAAAWVTALLFLIHPVQTEAVSCISGISNLWMTVFVLSALHAYFNKWHSVCLLCFTAAFLGKEQAVLFVPLVMVIDLARGKKNIGWWAVLAGTTGILCWLRQSITGASLLKDITVSPGELYLRLAAVPRDLGMYLRLIFFPSGLHYYRSTDILQPNTAGWIMAGLSVIGLCIIYQRRPAARPVLFLGAGWFLAALLPVLNIVPLINEYSFILTPEHFLYLPIVGILIISVAAADHFLKCFKGVALGAVVTGCLLLTWHQNTFWKSEIVLFERMLRFEPDFGRGHLLLAKAYYLKGRFKDAERHFARAYTVMAGYAKKASNLTAKRFYLKYVSEIQFYRGLNDRAMGLTLPPSGRP